MGVGLMKRLRRYMSGHLLSEINPEALIRWIIILAPVLPWPAATEWSTFWRDASCFCHRRQFQPPSYLWHSKLQVGLGHVNWSQKEFDSTRRGSEALRNRNHSWCKSLKLLSAAFSTLNFPLSISDLMPVSFHQCRRPLRLSICRTSLFCKQ